MVIIRAVCLVSMACGSAMVNGALGVVVSIMYVLAELLICLAAAMVAALSCSTSSNSSQRCSSSSTSGGSGSGSASTEVQVMNVITGAIKINSYEG